MYLFVKPVNWRPRVDSTAKKMCHFRSYTESAALEGIAGIAASCRRYPVEEGNWDRVCRLTAAATVLNLTTQSISGGQKFPEEKSADVRSRFMAG